MKFDDKGQFLSVCTKIDNGINVADISYNNLAEDTYCNDGETVEKKLADKNTEVTDIKKDIQDLNDKKQDAATAINTGNIGEQSVKHATSADSVEWTGVKNKPTTYPPSTHDHDDRYYTETEIDTKVNSIDDRLDNVEGILTSKDFLDNATFNNPTFTTDEPSDPSIRKGSALFNCDIYMNNRNIGGCSRLQATDGSPMVLAAGDGHTTGNEYVDLLGDYIQCRNTNGTAYVDVKGLKFVENSSNLVKDNIKDMTNEEANKILDVRIVDFDYKKEFGGQKGQHGVIAEEVKDIIPSAVSIPDGYDESKFDLSKGIEQPILSVAYSHFVPYLIKEVQILNDRINELEKKLNK